MREVRKHGPTSVMAAVFAILLAATPSAAERPEAHANITTNTNASTCGPCNVQSMYRPRANV